MAAFSRRPITGGPGSRFSTINRPVRSARSRSSVSNPNVIYVGQRRRFASARSFGRRRHLQIDRRGENLDASRVARWTTDRADRGRSAKSRSLCSSRSPAIPTGLTRSAAFFVRLDGGKTFEKTLYKDENTGGADVQFDPSNPEIVYASLWEAREGPWENGVWNGTGTAASSNRPMAARPGTN